ncbi:MAG: Type cbb3 cytochrome oxidase biogenesis protein CcoG, involved in Cu oxidation [uncultured Sulfurovum sp.]|uniref:Type cbb3 cytochrome oxidase biogenesis protein CcoG, involved in Cu oxidation n=1 Tax=uncultured Sulfurovum sp. TaxID=269237 RepID=A0A6S6U5P2_9BACT|nr:MAG: Type cbb3 cytochrome oxidase biogenesis protein CcoG, involved in Cu oxidation [uncultured Sulfurovum sp.]
MEVQNLKNDEIAQTTTQTEKAKKKEKAKKLELKMPFRIKRYYVYILITIFSLSLPFISIDGYHIFLLSFDKQQLHLMGTLFDMQELYMMPFVLMLLFIGIFAATSVGGRVFCGWACPQTIFRVIYRDLIETKLLGMRKRISNKQKEPNYSTKENAVKRVIAISIWTLLAFIAAANFTWFFVPPEDFFNYIMSPAEHPILMGMILGIVAFLVYDVIFLKEDWCAYICPYSRIQSVLYDENTLQAIYNPVRGGQIYDDKKEKLVFKQKDLPEEENECTTCEKCVTVCPTHIDIRKGLQLECINCLECVDACTTVMGNLGKESLVQWSSNATAYEGKETKMLRPVSYMYAVALALIVAILIVMSGEKEYMILDINKGHRLYKIEGQTVSNDYLMFFKNTEANQHTYKLKVVGEYADKITIKRFKETTVKAGKGTKEVLILSTNKNLSNQASKDSVHSIQLSAYSTSEPEKVKLLKEVSFIYPNTEKVK